MLLRRMEEYEQLLPLVESLGEDVSNLDYEHPEELRLTLIEAQEYRIGLLLDSGMGSATLFKTPGAMVTAKPYTCLITLSQPLFNQDPLTATRFMYDLDKETLESMPESLRIDNRDFLMYALDHEVFHCLDAYMNGYLYPRTFESLRACYDRNSAELRTEIFAAMRHLSRQPENKSFLINLANARTLNLLSWDVEHYTSKALHAIAQSSELDSSGDIKTLAKQTMRLAEKMTPTYAEHVQFLTAAWVVAQKFGLDEEEIPPDFATLADERPAPEKVRNLYTEISNVISAIKTMP